MLNGYISVIRRTKLIMSKGALNIMKSFRLIPALVAAAMLVGCVPSNEGEQSLRRKHNKMKKLKQPLSPVYKLTILIIRHLFLIKRVPVEA